MIESGRGSMLRAAVLVIGAAILIVSGAAGIIVAFLNYLS
jgi:hypothetical protein